MAWNQGAEVGRRRHQEVPQLGVRQRVVARLRVALQQVGLQAVEPAVPQEAEVLQEDLEAALCQLGLPVPKVWKLHWAKASEFA